MTAPNNLDWGGLFRRWTGGAPGPDGALRRLAEADPAAHAVVEAAHAVFAAFGPGHTARLYAGALAVELEARGVPHRRDVPVTLEHRGRPVHSGMALDVQTDDGCAVIVRAGDAPDRADLRAFLRALQFLGGARGLSLHFGRRGVAFHRFVPDAGRG